MENKVNYIQAIILYLSYYIQAIIYKRFLVLILLPTSKTKCLI